MKIKLKEFYDSILKVDLVLGQDKNTSIFLKAHINEIGIMMKRASMNDEINTFIDYFPNLNESLSKFLPSNKEE